MINDSEKLKRSEMICKNCIYSSKSEARVLNSCNRRFPSDFEVNDSQWCGQGQWRRKGDSIVSWNDLEEIKEDK